MMSSFELIVFFGKDRFVVGILMEEVEFVFGRSRSFDDWHHFEAIDNLSY